MENQKSVVLERLKESANVLVTVSTNPSVDQLAGAIGLTLLLNKLGKNATAVFSGDSPDTLEFLQPDKTLEKNTDSLRDFIIALDKAKADKLRYKVEDTLVKIFITPYRTSIDEEDLEFSHGDFNVDVVIALGVHEQQDLDKAITAHGRILHDATVISVNVGEPGNLGTINWAETSTSSLCEMLVDIGKELEDDIFDAQMATAFLTGIVAETDRFSNEKTSSNTMSVSAKLMAAGANQQLVATQLQEKQEPEESSEMALADQEGDTDSSDGSLLISHHRKEEKDAQIQIDEHGTLHPNQAKAVPLADNAPEETLEPEETPQPEETPSEQPEETPTPEPEDDDAGESVLPANPKFVSEPPSYLSQANDSPVKDEEPNIDPFSLPPVDSPFVAHQPSEEDKPQPAESVAQPEVPADSAADKEQTLSSLEESVSSPHALPDKEAAKAVADVAAADLESARAAVSDAVTDTVAQGGLEPVEGDGATPVNLDLGHDEPAAQATEGEAPQPDQAPAYLDVNNLDASTGLPVNQAAPPQPAKPPTEEVPAAAGTAAPPPPVPPPMMPPDMLPPLSNGSSQASA